MFAPEYHGTFAAPEERLKLFLQRVLPYVQAQEPLRVLEIGCSTGQTLAALLAAQNLPHTSLAQPKHRVLILQKNIYVD